MEYDVEREQGQYHVRERGQMSRGTTLTDGWLKGMGFWPLSRLNIDAAIRATMAASRGQILDPYAATHMPRDLDFKEVFASYPMRGPKERTRIPDSQMFKG